MAETLKIIIPMAGWGTRMRPQTWSKPKPLIGVAGKPSFDHLMDMFKTIPDPQNTEFIFIIGPFLGEQIPIYVKKHYPNVKAHYIVQEEMKGQSHTIWLARHLLNGPAMVVFSDTLLETDFSFLAEEKTDGVAWVKAVPDPRRFGVAVLGKNGDITKLIEKPQTMENNLAVVGCYYFKKGEDLVSAVNEQIKRGIQLKGEYFLADAINIMLENGSQMRTNSVDVWLDTGTIEATLETNRYMLEHGRDNSVESSKLKGVTIVPPVFIHPTAKVEGSVIGPHVSLSADCEVSGCVIRNSILDDGAAATNSILDGSFIGRHARVDGHPKTVNIGDNSSIQL
ncbi:MAG: sugar phosphate nucleotidyltransferase [Chloroflexota bacterium]